MRNRLTRHSILHVRHCKCEWSVLFAFTLKLDDSPAQNEFQLGHSLKKKKKKRSSKRELSSSVLLEIFRSRAISSMSRLPNDLLFIAIYAPTVVWLRDLLRCIALNELNWLRSFRGFMRHKTVYTQISIHASIRIPIHIFIFSIFCGFCDERCD